MKKTIFALTAVSLSLAACAEPAEETVDTAPEEEAMADEGEGTDTDEATEEPATSEYTIPDEPSPDRGNPVDQDMAPSIPDSDAGNPVDQ